MTAINVVSILFFILTSHSLLLEGAYLQWIVSERANWKTNCRPRDGRAACYHRDRNLSTGTTMAFFQPSFLHDHRRRRP